jgi:macrolide transport system ATP-binding/permease protein
MRNKTFGFVFQEFFLLAKLTARENTEMPLVYARNGKKAGLGLEFLELVRMGDRKNHYPNELSGGQQQRVAIARSLINEPKVIFADEPTGNLDSRSGQDIMQLLGELHRAGKTIIVITHDEKIASFAERTITLFDGEIKEDKRSGKKEISPGHADRANKSIADKVPDRKHTFWGDLLQFGSQAFRSIFAHPVRSILSVLGILIGVASLIAMQAIGSGAKESIEKQLSSLGSNILMLMPGSRQTHGVALEAGAVTRFTLEDAQHIKKIPYIKGVSPSIMGRVQVVYGNRNRNTQLQGVGLEYQKIRLSEPVFGRFFSDLEVQTRRRSALVGRTIVKEVFQNHNPIGKTIKVNRIPFTVIGILPEMGVSHRNDRDDIVLIPITTAMFRVLGKKYIDFMDIDVAQLSKMDTVKKYIEGMVMQRHRLTEKDQDSFYIRDMTEIREALMGTMKTLGLLLSSVAAIALLVGGIGIMNIMLVTVQERTREIGLRKAVGARRKDITLQFLIESAFLSLSGGILGIGIGTLISVLIAFFGGWAIRITPQSLVLSVIFSAFIGIFFGMWPALKASRLEPIMALRYQ